MAITTNDAPATAPSLGGALSMSFRGLSEYAVSGALIVTMLALVGLPMAFVVVSAVLKDPFLVTSGFSFETVREVYTSRTIWHAAWQTVAMAVFVGVVSTAIGGL